VPFPPADKPTHSNPKNGSGSEADDVYVAQLTMHQGAIHAYVNSLLPGDPEIEDILQRANVVLWRKRLAFEPGTNFKAWAFSIARWETRAWLTEKKRSDWLVFNDEMTDRLAGEFQELPAENNDSGAIQALRVCLARLDDKQRFLILNFYQNGKSVAECAKIVNRKEGTLRVALFRIRAALRRCIESQPIAKEVPS